MKVLHSACFLRPSIGIVKQMKDEQAAAESLGIDWEVTFFVPYGQKVNSKIFKQSKIVNSKYLKYFFYKIFAWLMIRIEYHYWLYKKKDLDIVLIRYSVHDVFQLIFLLLSNKRIFLVHHTLEEPELRMNKSLIGRLRYQAERFIGKFCIKRSAGIIGVTNEIIEYEKNRINNISKLSYIFPNGINTEKTSNTLATTLLEDNNTVLKLLFVASEFSEWHGLDLLLKDLKNNSQNFELHLIGSLLESDYNFALTDKRIKLHGVKDKFFIESLSKECNIALGSFALFRKDMYEACTLKVREYLNLGLPVFSGHKDIFPEGFKFYKIGNPRIDEIFEYWTICKKFNKKQIIQESNLYIDKKVILKSLYNELIKLER